MIQRTPPERNRLSNLQAVVFVIAIVAGLIVGWMMVGAVVGAIAIVLPGFRADRNDRSSPAADDAPTPPRS